MGTTINLALPYPDLPNPADVPADMKKLADKVDVSAYVPLVTTLPGSPVEGQEIYYMPTVPAGVQFGSVPWHLRRTSGAWLPIGAAEPWEVHSGPTTQVPGGPSGAVVPNGPAIVIPVAGNWRFDLRSSVMLNVATAGGTLTALMSVVKSTSPTAGITAIATAPAAGTGGGAFQTTLAYVFTAICSAGDNMAMWGQTSTPGSNVMFAERQMLVRPIKIT